MKEDIFKLYEQGKSYREIQAILGCSKGTISYHLGKGQKEKTANRRKQQRHKAAAYIRKSKEGKKCTDCREEYPYWILEFDHLPEYEKSFTIGGGNNKSMDLNILQAEIDKCEIVCANCHKNRTYRRQLKNGEFPDTERYWENGKV